MNKIRITHLVGRLEPLGYSRTVLDILTRADHDKYDFALIAARRPSKLLHDSFQATKADAPSFVLKDIPAIVIPELGRSASFFGVLKNILSLVHVLKEFKPDILHVHSIKMGLLGTLAGRLAGVPSILYSSYGLPKGYKKKRRNWDFLRADTTWWFARVPSLLADLIVTVTPHGLEEEFSMRLAPRSKYRVIYNAIAPERFENLKHESAEISKYRMGWDAYFPILGTATRLDREKGLEFLLEAVAHLKTAFPDILLIIIGDGPLRENLLMQSARLNLSNQIRFLGLREDVPTLLRLFDIFVLPSLYEATGIVLAEAMACGKPVITTRVGGLPELIQEGEDGFLVPPGDSVRLAQKISQVARDRDFARRVGERAASKARHLFDMRKMINDYEGLYQTLLKRPQL